MSSERDADLEPHDVGAARLGVLVVGTQVGGFRVKRLLGEGAMGEVYLAQDVRLGRRVALKLIKHGVMQGDGLARFVDEARATASFSHPNIVTIHEFGDHEGRPFLALEYLDGETLRDRLRLGPLPAKAAIRILAAVSDAITEAHRLGLVHADLKPENIFIPRDGRVRVLDFGLARMIGASIGASGTPAYMAPERWRGLPMTGAADVWALGVILFELITGRRACPDTELPRLAFGTRRIELPEAVLGQPWGPLVVDCLALDPARRPAAGEVQDRLSMLLDPIAVERDQPRSPFPGLAAFKRSDAARYVGRQDELATLVEQLRGHALVPITGPSGIGKSSFVHAALVPRLEEAGRWLALTCRPGASPFESMAAALDGAPPAFAATLRARPEALALRLHDVANAHAGRVLLFIDQFEEAFTLAPAEATAFCDCLGYAANVDEPWRIVLTIRNDFLGKLAEARQLRRHLGAVIALAPMTVSDLRAAVTVPLALAGYRTDEPELAARIANDVAAQPASLPLLQFACLQLWQRRDAEAKLVMTRDYDAMAGASGALAAHAQRLIAQLSSEEVRIARTLLLALVHPDGTRRPRLRSELLDGLPASAAAIVDRLLDGRLVIASREAEHDAAVIELAHEALATAWPQLARWLDETHEQRLLVLEIEQASLLWARRGRRDVETWTGAALGESMRRVDEWQISLPEVARAFLDAGLRRDRRVRRRRRTGVITAIGLLGAATIAASLTALAFSRKQAEAIAQQAVIRTAAADIGEFDLELEPFDWNADQQTRSPPSTRPPVTWQLHLVDHPFESERGPGAAFDDGDVHGETPGWHGNVLAERVQARSGPAFLVVERGDCPPSLVFLQRLPKYQERSLRQQFHVFVPTCQASAAGMVAIPAGAFIRNVSGPAAGSTTDERTDLTGFAIDRAEVTRGAFRSYGAMEALTGEGAADPDDPRTRRGDDRFPIVGINFLTARDYCRYLGKELPTVDQWQKAFRGGLELAGAPNPRPDRTTTWLGPTPARPANLRYDDDDQVAEIGSFPSDTSPYGVVDMVGNVSEWSLSRPASTSLKQLRTVLGSNWDIPASLNLHLVTFRNSRHDRYLDFTLGVRCVTREPHPAR